VYENSCCSSLAVPGLKEEETSSSMAGRTKIRKRHKAVCTRRKLKRVARLAKAGPARAALKGSCSVELLLLPQTARLNLKGFCVHG